MSRRPASSLKGELNFRNTCENTNEHLMGLGAGVCLTDFASMLSPSSNNTPGLEVGQTLPLTSVHNEIERDMAVRTYSTHFEVRFIHGSSG